MGGASLRFAAQMAPRVVAWILGVTTGLTACLALSMPAAAALSKEAGAVSVHHDWGKPASVYQYGRFYAAAAPDEAAVRKFKQEQGGLVIDLRSFKEMDCGSRTAAAKAGVAYQNVPLDTDGGFKPEAVREVERQLAKAPPGQPVLIACKTGNRSAAMLALHLAREEHLSASQTLALAQRLGMTSPELKAKLRRYLRAQAPTSSSESTALSSR